MNERRKTIGVFMAQPESAYQNEIMRGITDEAFKHDMDVLVFAMFLKDHSEVLFASGERNIYRLANMDKLDAVIFMPDVIVMKSALEYIENVLLKDFNKPVVYINKKNDKHKCILSNEDSGFEQLVNHLHKKHGCNRIAMVSGHEWNIQSVNRIDSFRRAMAANGLSVDDSLIYYGDFWYNKGDEIAEKLLALDKLPDAAMCACDTLALSLVRGLEKRGVRVPQDIIVTGYDCDSDGIDQPFYVTSATRTNDSTAANAVRYIASVFDKTEYVPVMKKKAELVTSCSCGCRASKRLPRNTFKMYYCSYDNGSGFYSGYNFMLEDMIGAYDTKDCLWKIDWYSSHLGEVDNFYICLCNGWDSPDKDTKDYFVEGYSDKMTLAYIKNNTRDAVDLTRIFDTKQLLPDLDAPREKPAAYYFLPMHFADRCFGYYVLKQTDGTIPFCNVLSPWARSVSNAFESLRRQIHVHYMCRKIDESAVLDLATGLYSRNGFNIYAPQMLKKAKYEQSVFTFIIGDLNCLKYINDTYGHIEGDFAITKAAEAFSKNCPEINENCRMFRIGGDEFVEIIVGHIDEKTIDKHVEAIRSYLGSFNDKHLRNYPIIVSLGVFCRQVEEIDTIDTITSYADREMFRDKQRIKETTGFNFSRSGNY